MADATIKPRRQYAKTPQRRVDIIDAATAVFSTRGYHGGSLRDIAKQLDLSLTALVHHFPSKSELLEAVLDRADEQASWLEDVPHEAGVRVAVLRLWTHNYSHPELLRLLAIMASEASAPDHPAHQWFVDRYNRVISNFAELITFDQEHGRISSDFDSNVTARALVATWDGLQLQWLLVQQDSLTSSMEAALDRILGPVRDSSNGA